MENNKNAQNQINIELPEETAQGTYANLAIISHSSSEFVIDYVRMMPGIPKAKVQSRIILTPEHAKRLMHALKDNIVKYEGLFGTIKIPEGNGPQGIPMTFSGPAGEA
ncbi:MAG: DUF3467 domain-containing protein [Bacteroidetes bacterium HGW-Bacteroidetes-21]|jgi:hypothetical protein|nr:MAG: DUF3467 domain-containing protein [Bacteroidetes bacterium HGW-Bacteroidetes-21]